MQIKEYNFNLRQGTFFISLSSITDNIIVYDSDIGAEMIYKNKTVIAGGNPRYKKFCIGEFQKQK